MYTSALWAIRCTLVHYGQSGVHQCTIGNQVYNNAPWAIRCTPVHYGQSGGDQCTMGKQVSRSANVCLSVCPSVRHQFEILRFKKVPEDSRRFQKVPEGSRRFQKVPSGTSVHYGQTGVHQCTMGNQVYTSALWAKRCTLVHYVQSGVH